MKVTCHRAFDMARDHAEAIEALVRAGVDRVLTSGRHETALEGLDVLAETVRAAAGRLTVMVCGGLNAENVALRHRRDGSGSEVHFAALRDLPSAMRFRNPTVGMGGTALSREYTTTVTDENAVRAVIAAARRSGHGKRLIPVASCCSDPPSSHS